MRHAVGLLTLPSAECFRDLKESLECYAQGNVLKA